MPKGPDIMLTIDQIKALAKRTPDGKLLPTTIEFLKEMREVVNFGHARRGEPLEPWTEADEASR